MKSPLQTALEALNRQGLKAKKSPQKEKPRQKPPATLPRFHTGGDWKKP